MIGVRSFVNIEEKYERALSALKKIAAFGHAADCNGGAPVHECCCYEKDEQEIAAEVLEELGE